MSCSAWSRPSDAWRWGAFKDHFGPKSRHVTHPGRGSAPHKRNVGDQSLGHAIHGTIGVWSSHGSDPFDARRTVRKALHDHPLLFAIPGCRQSPRTPSWCTDDVLLGAMYARGGITLSSIFSTGTSRQKLRVPSSIYSRRANLNTFASWCWDSVAHRRVDKLN